KVEKKAFEDKLKTDASLQKEVEIQRDVIKGIERVGAKQSIQKAYKKYKLGKSGFNLGLGTIILVAVVSAFLWYSDSNKAKADVLPQFNENGEEVWVDADKYLESQKFTVNTSKDTVIETEGGIVMYIPSGSFLDDNGNEVKGEVEFEVKEALNTSQIIQAGLSSKSGDRLLESAGMFYVNARKDGKTVQINPDKGIYTEVPADDVNPNMQLFDGKRMADGSIDWVDPKPLDKFLTPVDINSLNFYPPKYEPKLAELGRDASKSNKEYKDSLYYSFSWEINNANMEEGERLFFASCIACHSIGGGKVIGSDLYNVSQRHTAEWLSRAIKNYGALVKSGDNEAVRIFNLYNKSIMPPQPINDDEMVNLLAYIKQMSAAKFAEDEAERMVQEMFNGLEEEMADTTSDLFADIEAAVDSSSSDSELVPSVLRNNGINPAKIKAIWSNEFNNTLISTREFEERLKTIFGTCNDAVLDLYINNMNLNLYEIDEMAASMTSGESKTKFMEFASRKDGKVEIDDKRVKKLQKHYERKQKMIAAAVAKTKKKFNGKQRRLDGEIQKERKEHSESEVKRKSDNYVEEFNLNLKDAYRQLGMKKPKRLDAEGIYKLTLKTGGWKNVDAYVMKSLNNRETLDYTDPTTGKKAVIKYEPISVTVVDEAKYDRVLVYILPDKLNSFMRMKKGDDRYTENLNELMKNSVICLAYIGEQAYFYSDDDVSPKEHNIELVKMSQAELKGKLNRYDSKQRKNLLKEIDYQFVEVMESERQDVLVKRRHLREEIEKVIFPCSIPLPSHIVQNITEEAIEVVDWEE
ncbi:MAG: cytochrome c, partial [Flavobacteriales bacterium]|nr:cytochrome c [Flavobacteriales bacterium]